MMIPIERKSIRYFQIILPKKKKKINKKTIRQNNKFKIIWDSFSKIMILKILVIYQDKI